jgi:cell division protein FtsB
MNRNLFTEEQMIELKKNVYVKHITKTQVFFTKEFKQHFIDENNNGKGPTRIFIESGLSPYILGSVRIKRFSQRVKKQFKNNIPFDDNLGKRNSGRHKKAKKKELSKDEEIEKLKHENSMLKAENDLLKKMEFLVKQQRLKKLEQKKDIN